jgi:predicted glycosyltransferase
MREKGHELLFVARNKEIEHRLLDSYGIPFVNRGKGKDGKIGKFIYLVYANYKLWRLAKKFKPDVFLNFLHPYPSQVASLIGRPSLVFSDTEHAVLHHRLTVPFATKIFTPACYRTDLGEKQVRFEGYMELSYLHPKYFTPNPDILAYLGVQQGEKFVVVRFVSWEAAHDFGHAGMSLENKRKAIAEMSKYAKVFISAERGLPEDLEKYRIKIPFDKIHDALYFSTLLFGESATMASEAAVLGTPAIFMDNDGRGYTDEEEARYGLVFNFSESEEDQQNAIKKAIEVLTMDQVKDHFKKKREQLLAERIDTTAFMVAEVEKYHP